MKRKVALTTVDNPYNPFEDFDSWLMYDIEKGYNTNGILARMTNIKNEMTDQEQANEIERAIDRIIEIDPTDLFKKIVQEDYEDDGGGV